MAIYQSGGSFLPGQEANITSATAWNFVITPTLGTSASSAVVSTTDTQTLTNKSFTNPTVTGDASSGLVISKTVSFVEDATSTTFTGTVVIPAGATLVDIVVTSSVLWSKASSRFTCGDAQAATGWFTSTNLNATDLLVGEAIRAAGGVQSWAGVNGTYLVSATGVFGQATSTKAGPYYVTAGSVIGVVTVTPGAGAAGRTFMTVTYSVGQSVAVVLA